MDRRRFLSLSGRAGALAGIVPLAGCAGVRSALVDDGRGTGGESTRTAPGAGPETVTAERVDGPTDAPADRSLDVPRGLLLANRGRDRYATVVVERGERTLLVDSRSLTDGAVVDYPALVDEPGSYRVVVETAVGGDPEERHEYTWRVEGALGDLLVGLDGSVTTTQVAYCLPDCRPLSRDGTATFDRSDRRARLSRQGAPGGPDAGEDPAFVFQNSGSAPRAFAVRVDADEATVLDYTYELPGRTRAVLSLRPDVEQYEVSVSLGGISHGYVWTPRPSRDLWLLVDDERVDFFDRDRSHGPVVWR